MEEYEDMERYYDDKEKPLKLSEEELEEIQYWRNVEAETGLKF